MTYRVKVWHRADCAELDGQAGVTAAHAMIASDHTTPISRPLDIMLNMGTAVRIDTIDKFALIGLP